MAFPERTEDPREPLTLKAGIAWTTTPAPADSPAGGPGPGGFNSLQPYGRASGSAFHHTLLVADPAAQDWSERLRGYTPDALDGVLCVQEARDRSFIYLPDAIADETGRRLEEILQGILPGLVFALVTVAATTVLGAGIGGLVGALGFGVGAIPGAAAGAVAGAKVGFWLLTWLGLAMLVDYVADNIGQAGDLVLDGVQDAWAVRGKPRHVRQAGVDSGARKIARGVAVFFRLLLEAVVMYLLAKGAGAVAQRLPQLVAQLRRSRLGARFAAWIEANAQSLIRDPKLNPELRARPQGSAAPPSGGTTAPPKPAPKPQPKPKPAETPAKPKKPRKPNNSKYAGKQYPPEKLPPKVREKYPDSVRFTEDGYPDFSPYAQKSVKVEGLTGQNANDFKLANQAAGLKRKPQGWTWHHHQDGKTMQLVPTDLHDAVRHSGGASILRNKNK